MNDTTLSVVVASLLGCLRFVPIVVFAQPFSSIPIPVRVRVIMGFGLALGASAGASPVADSLTDSALLLGIASEVELAVTNIAILNLAFGSVFFIGRVLDIQAGFGLATIINPASHEQQPLLGGILMMGATVIFFAVGGAETFIRLAHEQAVRIPFGAYRLAFDPKILASFAGYCYLLSIQFGAAIMLILFVVDCCIAFLSRTVPQLNVLVLSIQVKTLLLLALLGGAASLLQPFVTRLTDAAFRFIGQTTLP
jgi:flagellar biosynthesis protein FliR